MKSLDRISALPQVTIEQILSLMPIRDAVRTSILSSKWRYSWTNMPKLVFNDELVNVLCDSEGKPDKYKLAKAIFHILLLYKGPISELWIHIVGTEDIGKISNELESIILHLSRSKSMKKFIFEVPSLGYFCKLPRSFFSLQELEHLFLQNCNIKLPLMFNGFNMLKSLVFDCVNIEYPNKRQQFLQQFLTGCPLLEEFTLYSTDMIELTECDFVELLKSLPSIQVLNISHILILAAGDMPRKLPISLPHLRILSLGVSLLEFSAVVCVISNSPKLEKLKLWMSWDGDWESTPPTMKTLIDDEDYMGLNLGHLTEMEIIGFNNFGLEMEFVKLIMAKSPVLKKARIELHSNVSVEEELKMLRDLLYFPLPRASSTASFTIERP